MMPKSAGGDKNTSGGYARYVLVILTLVYVFNYLDRQILAILAEQIKADIGLSDADIGFLYGTAFAVFYALFGIPLGRVADVWIRKNLIAGGLMFWSAMTVLSGTARSFGTLAAYRVGVGVGEASASPAAYSMLIDYFPLRWRATAISIYSSGLFVGSGIGIFLGGIVLDWWQALYPDPALAPLGLKPWQAAYMLVGTPGLLLAILVWRLREPPREQAAPSASGAGDVRPFRAFAAELAAIVPPLNWVTLQYAGASGRGLALSVGVASAICLAVALLTSVFGTPAQWIALGIGAYAAFSWAQWLELRDRPASVLIFDRVTLLVVGGFSFIGFTGYSVSFWVVPYFFRAHGISPSDAGLFLGLPAALGGWIGVTGGGMMSDWLKSRHPSARVIMGLVTAVAIVPVLVLLVFQSNVYAAYVLNFIFAIIVALWIGPAITAVNELVLPRMRAVASAFYILVLTLVGLALGPYTVGRLSDLFLSTGSDAVSALRTAMLLSMAALVPSVAMLALASGRYKVAELSGPERARLAGEAC